MSFSLDLKKELISRNDSGIHCRIAELAGIFSVNARFLDDDIDDVTREIISIRADSEELSQKISRLLYNIFERKYSFDGIYVEQKNGYRIIIRDDEIVKQLKSKLKLIRNDCYAEPGITVTQQNCCKKAYLRGVFLAGGSISSPEKAYQLEIACTTAENAERLITILKTLHLEAKSIKRKNRYIVYIKDGNTISDFLGLTGGMNSLMEFENIRILKDIRNSINREVNCDTANINKVVNAASKQIDDINLIIERKGLDSLPEQLRIVAEARLMYPHLSLSELGEKLDKPLGKSGVNHRLTRINEIAEKIRSND